VRRTILLPLVLVGTALALTGCRAPQREVGRHIIPLFPHARSLPFLPKSAKSFWLTRAPGVVEVLCGKRLCAIGVGIKDRGQREEAAVAEYRDGGSQAALEKLAHEFDGAEIMVQSWHELNGHRVLHRRRKPTYVVDNPHFRGSWTGYEWVARVGRFVIRADTRELMRACLGQDALSLGDLPRHVGADCRPDWTAQGVILRDAMSTVSPIQAWTYPNLPSYDGSVRSVVLAVYLDGEHFRAEWRVRTDDPAAFRKGIARQIGERLDDRPSQWKHSVHQGVLTVTLSGRLADDGLDPAYWWAIMMTYGSAIVV
jgi:predicted small secreted protein